MNPLVSLFCCLVARSHRKRGNRQTDGRTDGHTYKPSTITLAAHARRGLIIANSTSMLCEKIEEFTATELKAIFWQIFQGECVLVLKNNITTVAKRKWEWSIQGELPNSERINGERWFSVSVFPFSLFESLSTVEL